MAGSVQSWGWINKWNRLTTVTPVAFEIRIKREDARSIMQLAHAHEAGIGERHGHAMILGDESSDRGKMFIEIEG
jgi:hypothetical protein